MINITLPDGTIKTFDQGVTPLLVADSIGARLSKEAVVARVNGVLWDLGREITENAHLEILTRTHEDALDIFRHDGAHVLAQAVKELFPECQITIGPAIENGFYYDIFRSESFTPDDLIAIEKRMAEIVDRNDSIVREVWDRDEAISYFKSIGEHFKAEIIADIPPGEAITLYRQGSFIDLCRGPHMVSTGRLGKAFKLMKLAGSYWRGDHRNPVLQRIYGTIWPTEKELQAYLTRLEEAEKRDHRRLGRELDLFHLQEEAPGSIFWHPKGWTLYRTLQNFIRTRIGDGGYEEVNTPIMVDRSLWEQSGHWEKFRDAMFTSGEDADRTLCIKPMNCPCHVQIFKQGVRSYRDLPLRMAEFGTCHRNEPSGALHGLMRVRSMVQDDAHIFCTEGQIFAETQSFCTLLLSVYRDLGFTDVRVKLATRPDVRAGSDALWDKAEASLKEATTGSGLTFTLNEGEGAFYGPKLEFVLKDAIGRDWQCGTLQLDFVLPERLQAYYTNELGQKQHPVMLHRAILGSLERFTGILIEHYAGKFPLWLAPHQVVVTPITGEQDAYARLVYDRLKKAGIRVTLDVRNEKINYKVREFSVKKVPLIFVVGAREAVDQTVAIRRLGSDAQEILALQDAIDKVVGESAIPSAA